MHLCLLGYFHRVGFVAIGSIKGVLSGKHYNRSVMCHKLVYEAMERLRFEAFLDSVDDDEREGIHMLILDMMDSFPEKVFVDNLERPEIEAICESYEMFIQDSSQKSRTFVFWSLYIRMTGNIIVQTKISNFMMVSNE